MLPAMPLPRAGLPVSKAMLRVGPPLYAGRASIGAKPTRLPPSPPIKPAAENPAHLSCRATGWPRGGLYHHAAPAADEGRLRRELARLAARWPTYGYRRLAARLRREGWSVDGKR